jgi:hypothetical protein
MHLTLALAQVMGSLVCADLDLTDRNDLKMNQLQVIGSHNSYKQPIEPALLGVIARSTATPTRSHSSIRRSSKGSARTGW